MNTNIAPRLSYSGYDRNLTGLHANDELVVTVERDLGGLKSIWRDLERRAAGHVYQSYNWVSLWHGTVGRRDGVVPYVAVGRAGDGRALFLLPLGLSRMGGASLLVWLGGCEADVKCGLFDRDFLDQLSAPEWAALWRRILTQLPKYDAVYLDDQPDTLDGRPNPLAAGKTHLLADCTHATQLSGDWDTFYKAKRNGAARNLEKRRMRQLSAEGELRFEIAEGTGNAIVLMERLMAEKTKSLARMGVSDPYADATVREFYLQQTRRLVPNGTGHLSALTVDGNPVSLVWGNVFNKRFYYLVPVYDPAYSRASPGRLHLRELLRWSLENGIETFDMGVGEQDYKFNWCEEHVGLFATIEARTLRGYAITILLGSKTWFKRRIKTSKTLWPVAQTMRAQFAALVGQNG